MSMSKLAVLAALIAGGSALAGLLVFLTDRFNIGSGPIHILLCAAIPILLVYTANRLGWLDLPFPTLFKK